MRGTSLGGASAFNPDAGDDFNEFRRASIMKCMVLPHSAFTRMSRRVNRPKVIVTGGLKVALGMFHSAYTWMSRVENRSEVVVTVEI
jgi:hypothetical protein